MRINLDAIKVWHVALLILAMPLVPLITYGFTTMMLVLWLFSIAAAIMFHLALTQSKGVDGLLLSWLVHAGKKNGLEEVEVYRRGRKLFIFISVLIPFCFG